jgi:hypothetical protein
MCGGFWVRVSFVALALSSCSISWHRARALVTDVGAGSRHEQPLHLGRTLPAERAPGPSLFGVYKTQLVVLSAINPQPLDDAAVADVDPGASYQAAGFEASTSAERASGPGPGDPHTNLVVVDSDLRQYASADAATFTRQPQQQVLTADVHALESLRLLSGQAEYLLDTGHPPQGTPFWRRALTGCHLLPAPPGSRFARSHARRREPREGVPK